MRLFFRHKFIEKALVIYRGILRLAVEIITWTPGGHKKAKSFVFYSNAHNHFCV